MRCGEAPVLELLDSGGHKTITINNVRLFLGIVRRRANLIINAINLAEQPVKVLAKKDRIPKFNIKEKKPQQ